LTKSDEDKIREIRDAVFTTPPSKSLFNNRVTRSGKSDGMFSFDEAS